MDDEDYRISSELYDEFDYTSFSKPTANKNNAVSKFIFQYPQYPLKDSDGDFIVPQRKSKDSHVGILEIEHSKSTILDLVGLQIWRGSLLLADWLLYNGKSLSSDFYILELGSGVGLTSIIAAMFVPVLCTDVNKGDLFNLIRSNVNRNKHISRYPVDVLALDFLSESIPPEILTALPKTPIIIAADVVYDDTITKAFLKTVEKLLSVPPRRSVFVALEKRYVFTISDCDSAAPCYEYYLEQLKMLKNVRTEEVPLDFPKYFQYDRVKELVLWKITS